MPGTRCFLGGISDTFGNSVGAWRPGDVIDAATGIGFAPGVGRGGAFGGWRTRGGAVIGDGRVWSWDGVRIVALAPLETSFLGALP